MENTDQIAAFAIDIFNLLQSVRNESGELFSGIGILVSDTPNSLPTFPLRPSSDTILVGSTVNILSSISKDSSDLHDGFHLLSSDLKIRSLSLYFSPPILPSATAPHPTHKLGGRYMAALFGSALPGVMAAGVASPHYGVVVFKDGKEIAADAR